MTGLAHGRWTKKATKSASDTGAMTSIVAPTPASSSPVYSVDTTIFVGPTCLISVPTTRDSDQFDSRRAPDVYW